VSDYALAIGSSEDSTMRVYRRNLNSWITATVDSPERFGFGLAMSGDGYYLASTHESSIWDTTPRIIVRQADESRANWNTQFSINKPSNASALWGMKLVVSNTGEVFIGDPGNDFAGVDAGAVYVGGTRITAPDAAAGAAFGTTVAYSDGSGLLVISNNSKTYVLNSSYNFIATLDGAAGQVSESGHIITTSSGVYVRTGQSTWSLLQSYSQFPSTFPINGLSYYGDIILVGSMVYTINGTQWELNSTLLNASTYGQISSSGRIVVSLSALDNYTFRTYTR
jgi:hypothetical protein